MEMSAELNNCRGQANFKRVTAAFKSRKVLVPSILSIALCGPAQAQTQAVPIPDANPAVPQIITLKGGTGYVLPTAATAFVIPRNITLRVERGARFL